jgi:hypothetical protein
VIFFPGASHDARRRAGDHGGRKQEFGPDHRPKLMPAALGKSGKLLTKQGAKQPTQAVLKRAHSAAQADPDHEAAKRKLPKAASMPLAGSGAKGKHEAPDGNAATRSPTNQPLKSSTNAFGCTLQPLTLERDLASTKGMSKGSSAAGVHTVSSSAFQRWKVAIWAAYI